MPNDPQAPRGPRHPHPLDSYLTWWMDWNLEPHFMVVRRVEKLVGMHSGGKA